MTAVIAGEISPIVSGMVYCGVIEACKDMFDLRRAQEWTAALARWWESQPDIVPFRGNCLVYRAELMRFHGAWGEATDEAQRALEWLSRPPPEPAVAEAIYQLAELDRLRGAFAAAEAGYREASSWGRLPEPGLALLRLAQGDAAAASAAIRRAIAEAPDDLVRARMLEPAAEIALAAGDVVAARDAADRLGEIAAGARGAAAERDGGPGGRLGSARGGRRRGCARGAQARVGGVARSRRTVRGGPRSCQDGRGVPPARRPRRRRPRDGGRPRGVRAARRGRRISPGCWAGPRPAAAPGGLSPRELEILRLVAAGLTNRAIAESLTISERTVDRHVSNIFTKLDVSTRAAATAFAYEHGLV